MGRRIRIKNKIEMKKVSVRFRIPFGEWLRSFISDLPLPFTKDGREEIATENHDKYYVFTGACFFNLVLICYFIPMSQVFTMGWVFIALLSFLFGLIVNAVREGYLQDKGGKDRERNDVVPFSWRDCRFGAHGACHGALAAYFIVKLVIALTSTFQ